MFDSIFEGIATLIAVVGTIVISYGSIKAIIVFLSRGLVFHDESKKHVLDHISLGMGRHLILGLEFFIASDIISIAINPGWDELGQLAIIIILRTILSTFLTRELRIISQGTFNHQDK
ncbi:DUF1622 domain-containing protein [Patescibacteria group bacterium]